MWLRDRHNESVEQVNEIIRFSRDMIGGHAKLLHLERYEEWCAIPGLDTVAQHWDLKWPGCEYGDVEKLFAMLKRGVRPLMGMGEARELAARRIQEESYVPF